MKIYYKVLSVIIFLVFVSTNLFSQSTDLRRLEELRSGQLSNIAAQNGVVSPVGVGGVLLVQDNAAAGTDTIEQVLIGLSLPYTRVLNTVAVTMNVASWLTYDAVFWIGTTSDGSELDSCTAFLAAGGNLLVMDGDEAYFFGDTTGGGVSTPLFDTYFQAALISDDGSDGVCDGEELLEGISIDLSADPWPDDVTITGPNAVKILNAALSDSVGGLRASDGTYRAVLLCWDPENVSVDSTTLLIQKVYDYLVNNIIPVELTSFAANVNVNDVTLSWTTATETNNSGFEVQRKSNNGNWINIDFVAGFGTTTETKSYSYSDNDLNVGNHSYRLKQIDFNGTFEYSNEVNVEVGVPDTYTLDQNYPNPFNPSTLIKYSVTKDGFVNVSVFNLIGEKVATLVNSNMKAGSYEVNFNASHLSSGVYFYSIEAGDFKAVRKMMLMK